MILRDDTPKLGTLIMSATIENPYRHQLEPPLTQAGHRQPARTVSERGVALFFTSPPPPSTSPAPCCDCALGRSPLDPYWTFVRGTYGLWSLAVI